MGAPIWLVPKQHDFDAYMYPKKWKRNALFLCSGTVLVAIQFYRYAYGVAVSFIQSLIAQYLFLEFIKYWVYTRHWL